MTNLPLLLSISLQEIHAQLSSFYTWGTGKKRFFSTSAYAYIVTLFFLTPHLVPVSVYFAALFFFLFFFTAHWWCPSVCFLICHQIESKTKDWKKIKNKISVFHLHTHAHSNEHFFFQLVCANSTEGFSRSSFT